MATACVFTHRSATVVGASIDALLAAADAHGVELLAAPGEADKHPGLAQAAARTAKIGWPDAVRSADAAVVLAGDGTLLRVLNQLRDGPPVLGVNYGMVGYLSAVGVEGLDSAMAAIAGGRLNVVDVGVLEAEMDGIAISAVNDIVASGGATGRIIKLAWRILVPGRDGTMHVDDMGVVPCDGMVLSTAVGSTAYNLSNGGPVVAWGVHGYVVSFIAPHTLAARPLVVAPDHVVELEHLGRGAPLQVFGDGTQGGTVHPGQTCRVRMLEERCRLAVLDEPTFYGRYRDSFAVREATPSRRAVPRTPA